MKKLSYKYIAGFIDGEGCLTTIRSNKEVLGWVYPYIAIGNTNRRVIKRIQKKIGGLIVLKRYESRSRKDRYTLKLGGLNLQRLLINICPFLIVKKKQARLLLEFCDTLRRNTKERFISQELIIKREKIALQIARLNKTGKVRY